MFFQSPFAPGEFDMLFTSCSLLLPHSSMFYCLLPSVQSCSQILTSYSEVKGQQHRTVFLSVGFAFSKGPNS